MDPNTAERLVYQRMRLFLIETAGVQEGLDAVVNELTDGKVVPGHRVKGIADSLRNARSRLTATMGEDVA